MPIDLVMRGPCGAIFNESRTHRYLLWRRWADATLADRWLVVIGLNPSKADEWRSDPTVSQMVNRGKSLGFTGLLMLNSYALVSTYPAELKKSMSPVGTENDRYIEAAAGIASMIVCAWGTLAGDRGAEVEKLLRNGGASLHVWDLTKDGFPRHPRGLALSFKPREWRKAG